MDYPGFRLIYTAFLIIALLVGCDGPSPVNELNPVNPPDDMADSTKTLTFLSLGDSYTIGESVEEDDRWPVQLSDTLNTLGVPFDDPDIIARTGWRTDELIEAIEREKPDPGYDLVSLLIGVNNQYQNRSLETYKEEFSQLLMTAIQLAGGRPENVLVVSIPDYGYTPFGQKDQERISGELLAFNEANRTITETMGVRYVYITDISENGLSDTSLVAEDGLHPSGKQYALWVKRIIGDASFRSRYIND